MKGEAEVIGRVTGYNYDYGSGNLSAIFGKGGGVSHVGSEGKGSLDRGYPYGSHNNILHILHASF